MKSIIFLLISVCFCSACQQTNKEVPKTETDVNFNSSQELAKNYINAINYSSLNADSIKITTNEIGTVLFDLAEQSDGVVFKLNFKGYSDTLTILGETIEFYLEEDFNDDGIPEIGILPGYKTSACRMYYLYDVSNGVWKKIAETRTHLPDRVKGINYFSKGKNAIEILSASEDCCCQCECIISLKNISKRN
jgi:hypothetical protein